MAEAVSTYTLPQLPDVAEDLLNQITSLRSNTRGKLRLQTLCNQLLEMLRCAEKGSNSARAHVVSELEAVKQAVLFVLARQQRPQLRASWCCRSIWDEFDQLEEAENKLECLKTEAVVMGRALQLVKEIMLQHVTDCITLDPTSSLAYKDSEVRILDFLKESQSEELRVIIITGESGAGETMLLNHVWQAASSKVPFKARAYVLTGHCGSSLRVQQLQSSIIWQLGGGNMEFPSSAMGRAKLSKHLELLKTEHVPVFLALVAVNSTEDLENLLPSSLGSENFPMCSCILLSCRELGVANALLNICHLQANNMSQVFHFQPGMPASLHDEHQEVLNIEVPGCEDLPLAHTHDEHQEVLNIQVPGCEDLPLAHIHDEHQEVLNIQVPGWEDLPLAHIHDEHQEVLNIQVQGCQDLPLAHMDMGSVSVDGEKHKEMTTLDHVDPLFTSSSTNQLHHRYDSLSASCKAAFLDIVSTFYGWSWETTTRVVGPSAMQELEYRGFISQVESPENCKQSALREGYDLDQWHYPHKPSGHKVVTMHDSVLQFGEIVLAENNWHCQSIKGPLKGHALLQQISRFRNLVLCGRFQYEDLPSLLEGATNLKLLVLRFYNDNEILLRASLGEATNCIEHGLRSLMLVEQKASRLIMQMMFTREILDITLDKCDDIKELPSSTPLYKLERLRIRNCRHFMGFSAYSMEKWFSLRELVLEGCLMLREIPPELGDRDTLTNICVSKCPRLEWFPSLGSCKSLSTFVLMDCTGLKMLPDMSNCSHLQIVAVEECSGLNDFPGDIGSLSLRELFFGGCKSLIRVPDSIFSLSSLQVLDLSKCESLLDKLPTQMGGLHSLKGLYLKHCSKLRELPDFILSITSLEILDLSGCESLLELPEQLGQLRHLKGLHLKSCNELKKLPNSILSLTSLEVLDLSACESIAQLPKQIGQMKSLKSLCLMNCSALKKLPDSIVDMSSHVTLDLSGCESLVELPNEFGRLSSLKVLRLSSCTKLTKLPGSILRITKLEALHLDGCVSLVELPKQIGRLHSLKGLHLNSCIELQMLPASIFSITSLELLDLSRCVCSVELLEQLGWLSSLKDLHLNSCSELKQLPGSIITITSLEWLDISGCENLMELPKHIGELHSLKGFNLNRCTKLEKLPDSTIYIRSLEALNLSDCENLVELPKQISGLQSLKELQLASCRKLQKLPSSIVYLKALEALDLSACESLVKLPRKIGMLLSLKSLNLKSCIQLKQLPHSVCIIRSLVVLDLSNCESLVELPLQIGALHSLKDLNLKSCRKLKKLPDSIRDLIFLETFDLSECESLGELPECIGELRSLKGLNLKSWTKLEKLPDFFCYWMRSLESLDLSGCESLGSLPEWIGELVSLKYLSLKNCRKLENLPHTITTIPLERLDLSGCESLGKLPLWIGELYSLKYLIWSTAKSLELPDSRKLKKLPDSVCSMSSTKGKLKSLNLESPDSVRSMAEFSRYKKEERRKLELLKSALVSGFTRSARRRATLATVAGSGSGSGGGPGRAQG